MSKKCRMCKGTKFKEVIDFGQSPLVNSLLTKEEFGIEKTFPLVVEQCQRCHLVQTKNMVDAAKIYREVDYLFFSSDMPNLDTYFKRFADDVKRFLTLGDFIVEIGSNDGIFLKHLKEFKILGVDPASNVVLRALKNGVPTLSDFFNENTARRIKNEWGKASLITGFNCIAHLDDLDGLMRGVESLLRDDGVFVVEANYWKDMVKNLNYALIYHDHFSYFTLKNWIDYAPKFGMQVFDAEIPPAQGDIPDIDTDKAQEEFNIRVFLSKDKRPCTERMKQVLAEEEGLDSYETVEKYAKDVKASAKKLGDLIRELKDKGHTIAGYGAAAKGFSVLKLAEIDQRHIDYFIDDSPAKQNKYAPVSHIPIYKRENQKPDYFLITAPNYANVIIGKEQEFIKNGGKFITIKSEIIDGLHKS